MGDRTGGTTGPGQRIDVESVEPAGGESAQRIDVESPGVPAGDGHRAGDGAVDHHHELVTVPPDWWSWAGAQGGVVIAHCLAAMAMAVGAPEARPRSVTAHLLRPVREPLSLDAAVLRRGRAVTTASVAGRAGGRSALSALATFGPAGTGPRVAAPTAPAVERPEACPVFQLPVDFVPIGQHVEVRPASDARPLAEGPVPELLAWLRLVDDRPLEPTALAILLDALPPGLFATFAASMAVPTVDFTAHFSPRAARGASPGWALARLATVDAGEGWAIDDSELWSQDGHRLAVARQSRVIAPL
ncbi:MAG: thioesterase family protein [Acidimicrobiia bacterium]|nr:thioesterase family protein [Acidimicrobiia bacterium]